MEDRIGVACMLQPTIYHRQLLDATSWKPGLGQLVGGRGVHQQRLAYSILCRCVMYAYVLE